MVLANFHQEINLWNEGKKFIAGVDEVGRGPLAGPVVVGMVIFPPYFMPEYELRDSKLCTPKMRETLSAKIKLDAAAYSVGAVSHKDVDEFGIVQAIQFACEKALINLKISPQILLTDALTVSCWPSAHQKAYIKGDRDIASIAAASIVAKVYRDDLMRKYHETYPEYGFDQHKGYGTKRHIEIIKERGPCPLHRKCFLRGILV